MGTKEKLIERFLALPKDFTYDEVKRLFGLFGYTEVSKGSTSGSRVEFVSSDGRHRTSCTSPIPLILLKGM